MKQCELWNKFEMPNIYVIRIPEVKVLEKYLKKCGKKFSKFDENYEPVDLRIPMSPELNKTTPRHIIRKWIKSVIKRKS